MSGHSHWATIKRQKETTDLYRGKIFSKISRAIAIAARDGDDPETNFKLRLAIEKAKQANMPKENILRAIKRGGGKGEGEERWEEVSFEGYGPEGIGIIIEAVTDNKNRTTAEIKNMFEREGGSLAGPGAVSYQFKKMGLLTVEKLANVDDQILKLIDFGAQDVEEVNDGIEVYIHPEQLKEAREKIEKAGFRVKSAELVMKPTLPVVVNDPQKAQRVLKFMESLEDYEDIQKVYANFDIPDEILAQLSSDQN